MAFPAAPLIGLVGNIIGKILPGKPVSAISKMAETIVKTDKGLRDQFQQFMLAWFRPDLLPPWGIAVKNLWRPFLATTYGIFTMVYYIVKGYMPDKYFCLITISVVGVFGISRGIEKIKKHIV